MKNSSDVDTQLLKNGQLFNAIRKNKSLEDKLKKIQKYLDQGAEINAADANNKNNSPLHVAVAREEVQIVELLLSRGADINNKNNDDDTPIDIARQLRNHDGKLIQKILQKQYYSSQSPSLNQQDVKGLKISSAQTNNDSEITQIDVSYQIPLDSSEEKEVKEYVYKKRCGTSGLGGQLYETKLLCLILLRAINKKHVTEFYLATNFDGMGAFDDIVFRYFTSDEVKPKLMFIQAKHRDDPAKDKITVEEMFKQNGDFSLHKYLDSYIKISQRFTPINSDEVFRGVFKNTDCSFIIYTPALEKCNKKIIKEQSEEQYFLNTTDTGKIFQLEYDDHHVELLVQSVVRARASMLAKRIMKFILSGNVSNMMMDDVIKTYHIFLSEHVFELGIMDSTFSYRTCKFLPAFLVTKDQILSTLREYIYKEVATFKMKSVLYKESEIQTILKSLVFKVPRSLGMLEIHLNGNEQKKERRINYILSKLLNIFQMAPRLRKSLSLREKGILPDFVIKVDDSIIGPHEILQDSDFELYRLGGLVGNLLIYDAESKMLKFNMGGQYICGDCVKLHKKLQEEVSIGDNLEKYRLDINVHGFPRLMLFHEDHDRQLVKSFLNKLYFHTNQAKEDDMDNIAKQEINKYYNSRGQNDSVFRLRTDAIFLKVHDKIQKWWKQQISAPYLTKSCQFYHESEREILCSPLLSILNYYYREKLMNIPAEFTDIAVGSLEINSFMSSKGRILLINTEEIKFTAIKLIQHYKATNCDVENTFVDMDYVITGDCFESVSIESRESKASGALIVICEDNNNAQVLNRKLNTLLESFEGKVIIITNNVLAKQFKFNVPMAHVIRRLDEYNNFNDLVPKFRERFFEHSIVYQGDEIPLGSLIDEGSAHYIDSNVLRKIILGNEKISIGEATSSFTYDKTADYYVERTVGRHVTLKTIEQQYSDMYIVNDPHVITSIPEGVNDIILVADTENEFDKFCLQQKHKNLHWFRNDNKLFTWKKSKGGLKTLIKYVCRGTSDSCMKRVKTLKDLEEKSVIISGEPGMGKSTLLTHLAIHTKHVDRALWITKINLIEHSDIFFKWKVNNTKVKYHEAMTFMLKGIGLQVFKASKMDRAIEILTDKIVESIIGLDKGNEKNYNLISVKNVELFEINLFYHMYKNGKVALLLDGFDEICPDYADTIMDMISILNDSKLAHLWITTRSYRALNKLEDGLNIFSYVLQPLTPVVQKELLGKMWSKTLGYQYVSISSYVEEFFNIISVYLDDKNNKFTSFPLHLNMLAVLLEDYFKTYFDAVRQNSDRYRKRSIIRNLNLISLYERFVDIKFMEIRFGEKKRFMCIEDPDMRQLVEKERKDFIETHKKISAYFIFEISGHNVLSPVLSLDIVKQWFPEEDVLKIHNVIEIVKEREEKTGIIERVIGKIPKFVHLTFAEYFATEFVCDQLKSEHCTLAMWEYLVNHIFLMDKRGIRRFFNSKLASDETLRDLTLNKSYATMVFNALLWHQYYLPMTSLMTALDEYLDNISMFLLLFVKTVINKDNIHHFLKFVTKRCFRFCVVCATVEHRNENALKTIISLIENTDKTQIKNIFHCEDMPRYNALLLAVTRYSQFDADREILLMLMNAIRHDSDLIVELLTLQYDSFYTSVSQYIAVSSTRLHYFYLYLLGLNKEQRMAVLGVTDWDGKSPAHYAAKENNYSYFHVLHNLLDIEQFRQVCTTFDKSKWTPLYYFPYNREQCHDLKYFLEIVYNVTIINVHEFIFNIVLNRR